MDVEDVDSSFWWKLIGGLFVLAVASFVVLGVLLHVMNRWGLFGVIIAIGAVSLLAGWIFDRKKKREYEAAVAAADAADAAEARAKQA